MDKRQVVLVRRRFERFNWNRAAFNSARVIGSISIIVTFGSLLVQVWFGWSELTNKLVATGLIGSLAAIVLLMFST